MNNFRDFILKFIKFLIFFSQFFQILNFIIFKNFISIFKIIFNFFCKFIKLIKRKFFKNFIFIHHKLIYNLNAKLKSY